MANYTLSNLLADVNSRIAEETGTVTAALVTRYANESLRRLRRKFDVPTAEVINQIELYSGVFQYPTPYANYKDFVALRDNFQINDRVFMRNVSQDTFWSQLQAGNTRSEERNGATRTLLFNLTNPRTASLALNAASGVATDGTWVASNDAGNVRTDTLFYRTGTNSLAFDITASAGTATLTNSTMRAKDASGTAFLDTAMITAWIYLPSSTAYTNFALRWGSSATVFWERIVTTPIQGGSFVTGWNQLGFDWLLATETGSPTSTDAAALDYLRFQTTYAASIGNQTGLRLNDITMRQRRLFNLHSATDNLVVDGGSAATSKETFDSATDTSSYFNIDRSFIDFVLYETLEQIFTTHIADADTRAYYTAKRMELEQDLIMRHPSNRQPQVHQYNDTSRHDAWLKR